MNPSCGNGQRIRQVGNLGAVRRCVGSRRWACCGVTPVQEGRRIVGHIPLDKGRTGSAHASERSKPAALPEGVRPQAVQFFDLAIAFGFGDGQEDQFDAQVQTQSDELSEEARGFVAATKRGVVVELQKVRNSQGFPGVQACRITVSPLLSAAIVCVHARVRRFSV